MATGTLVITARAGGEAFAVSGTRLVVTATSGAVIARETLARGASGLSQVITFSTPDVGESLEPGFETPYAMCNVEASAEGYNTIRVEDVQIFAGEESVLPIEMIPLADGEAEGTIVYPIPPSGLVQNQSRILEPTEEELNPSIREPRILSRVFIPTRVTVHLGAPNSSAQNVTVPFIDYVKNVASSEIYPTWPEEALRANILAQISIVLNRIFTEWYPSRGYDFDITNSTAYDQYFVYGRNIFQSISDVVDDIFNQYIRRPGLLEPLFAQYCNGTTVTCAGLSQWGTVSLAENGFTAQDILEFYYGDVEVVTSTVQQSVEPSYPGTG